MEEVDNIILHSLRQLGVDIPSEVECLVDFPANLVVLSVSKCLQTILPDSDMPKALSSSMSQKFQIASRLAKFCQELGYKDDMGYQTFLYPAEKDLRRVLMFLIERLPKEYAKNEENLPTDKLSLLLREIRNKIEMDLNTPWIPPYCKNKSLILNSKGCWTNDGCSYVHVQELPPLKALKGSGNVVEQIQKFWGQTRNKTTGAIQENNSLNKFDDTRMKTITGKFEAITLQNSKVSDNVPNIQISKPLIKNDGIAENVPLDIEEPGKLKKEQTDDKKLMIAEMKQDIIILREEVLALKSGIEQLKRNLLKLDALKTQREADIEVLTKNLNLCKTFNNVPMTDDDIKNCNKYIEESEQRMSQLIKEWDEHRVPLEIEIQAIRDKQAENLPIGLKKLKEIEKLEQQLTEVKNEFQSKRKLHAELLEEYTNLSKNVRSRSGYTRKIMEIIGNISKQKVETDKILSDTKIMQKEINNLNGQLSRSFTLADEMIFKDVKKDEQSKQAYKLLANIHTVYGEITAMVYETGTCLRTIRDLEEQIDAEKAKNVQETLDQINSDLKQMQMEAQTLNKNT